MVEKIEELLRERKEYLEKVLKQCPASSKQKEGENVYAVKHHNSYQYYLKDNKQKTLKYIKAKDKKKALQIIQNEYNSKFLASLHKELIEIERMLKMYSKSSCDKVYNSFPEGKQIVITPAIIPDEAYIKQWIDEPYEKKVFKEGSPEYYTFNNERVRSKSEVIIANMLDKLGVIYKYEKPLYLKGFGRIHPDFTILDVRNRKEIYYEHLGMLDDEEYLSKAISKIRHYEKNGYYLGESLIISGETSTQPVDIKAVERKVKNVLGM